MGETTPHIYNTLLRAKQPLVPRDTGHVKMYVCGPTVYDLSHVGHARVYVVFDTVVRCLRRHFKVTYVRNLTDIDDKIIRRAQERKQTPAALSEHFTAAFQQDMATLGCAPADHEPKVTDHVPQVVAMVETLIAGGFAYAAAGDVYYAVERFAEYGRLGRRSLEDMEAGARVEVSASKRHPMDFVLWKAAKPGEPSWPSPWGVGRPGWHIECSAMSQALLGATFDVHGGGRDLIFPHHENEIAQSEAASGQGMAQIWMHGGLVNVDNTKMSKSLGNFFTIRDVLAKFDAQTLRFYLLSTHYRSPINFSDVGLAEAEGRLKYLNETLLRLRAATAGGAVGPGPLSHPNAAAIAARFDATMADDFNTPQAIGELSEMFRLANEIMARPEVDVEHARTLHAIAAGLAEVGSALGLLQEDPATVLGRIDGRRQAQRGVDVAEVERLIAARNQARAERDFGRADALREQLRVLGVSIKDGAQGTSWEAL